MSLSNARHERVLSRDQAHRLRWKRAIVRHLQAGGPLTDGMKRRLDEDMRYWAEECQRDEIIQALLDIVPANRVTLH